VKQLSGQDARPSRKQKYHRHVPSARKNAFHHSPDPENRTFLFQTERSLFLNSIDLQWHFTDRPVALGCAEDNDFG
jgi:hypothetical protein